MIETELIDDREGKLGNPEAPDGADRPLTPGGYLMLQPEKYNSTPPKQGIHDGAKTPGEGTGKRIGRKTFEAFQKFKNAFKMPKSNKVSSGADSQPGSKSGADNQNGEMETPKLEHSDSPEQLRDKAVKEFSADEFNAAKEEEGPQ